MTKVERSAMSRLQIAIDQILSSRQYTNKILETIEDDDWFQMPEPAVTHVAWQVGHIAVAQYGLSLVRMRGEHESDEDLISKEFRDRFNRASVPDADPEANPSVAEIRAVFDGVHEKALEELPNVNDEDLDLPPLAPHQLFDTRLGALHWTARHEMLHVGQIGLLRRLFGKDKFR
jgi:hypothetical protein